MSEPDESSAAPQGDGEPASDLFPTRLPISVAMGLGLFLVTVVAAVLAASIFVSVPDTIRCQFVLVPEAGAEPVRAPREGALAAILVAETAEVRKGQELFVIRSQELRAWTSELRTLEQDLVAVGRRRALLEEDQRSAVEIQAARIQQFDMDLTFEQEYLRTVRDFLRRYELLDRDGLVPIVDLKTQQLEASKGERDVAVAAKSRDMAALELTRLRTEHRKQAGELDLEQAKVEVRMATLGKLLDGAREDVVRVTAPYDGTVISLQKRNPGDAVSAGQELCRIARSDSALIAEIAPPEGGISRLRAGQRVQLFYQAYPYERFGTGRATVRWISPASVASSGGEAFLVHAGLDAQTLGAAGDGRMLRAGMRGEARVLAGRRTVIEFVFEPLRRLREMAGARP
jgi:membrane fusion protein